MAPNATAHRRTHNLLLLNSLISQLSTSSPFSLVLDSLEQSARPLLAEYIRRAKDAKIKVIFVSFETLARPIHVDVFIEAWSLPISAWQRQIVTESSSPQDQRRRTLLVFDSVNTLGETASSQIPQLLSSFMAPTVSLIAAYHTDIAEQKTAAATSYAPSTRTLLSYLATTVFTVHSTHHILVKKAARDRSLAEPSFGLDEGVEGMLQGLGANSSSSVVLEMEHRRKSGRGVQEWYVLQTAKDAPSNRARHPICLLEDYPGYHVKSQSTMADDTEEVASTFELGLTDRQRRDREDVVLPYFDAQRGNDQGGRILYDMGEEDDFDEEEDEI